MVSTDIILGDAHNSSIGLMYLSGIILRESERYCGDKHLI